MSLKICHVDSNIILTIENLEQLRNVGVETRPLSLKDPAFDFTTIQYLLMHSFLPDAMLQRMILCKYIGIRAHNTDYVNKALAREMGVTFEGLKNQYGINAVAEHTIMLILAVAKNLLQSQDNMIRGDWRKNLGFNMELENKTLGIVGYGSIGKRVAEMAKTFGMKVLLAGKPDHHKENELPLEQVLSESDIVSLHMPGTPENQGYMNEARLAFMKKGAILINTARGGVVDYQALAAALQNGQLRGAGLDVFPHEPAPQSELFEYPNVVCTPHVAYLTEESIAQMNHELIENFLAFLATENGTK